jgi:hypothetical protein
MNLLVVWLCLNQCNGDMYYAHTKPKKMSECQIVVRVKVPIYERIELRTHAVHTPTKEKL